MKLITAMSLFISLSTAFATEEFGGIQFDGSVPSDQISLLKTDINYLYQTPVTQEDEEFLKTSELKSGSGAHMHNWILNRVRYIVGEDFDLGDRLVRQPKILFKYPDTPIPDEVNVAKMDQVRTVMTNIGGALYLGGKMENSLLGLKISDEVVSVKSPRVGILQVGEGLFYEDSMINADKASPANSVSRISTLFHEARHSDGNGKSTGFVHSICPEGHDYEGHPACEVSGNGSYTIGALSGRHLLKNCTSCSLEDQIVLSAVITDAFDRIFSPAKAREKAALEAELGNAHYVYRIYLSTDWPESKKAEIETELKALKIKITELEDKLMGMTVTPDAAPAFLDATPEGSYKEVSVEKTSKLMKKSVSK